MRWVQVMLATLTLFLLMGVKAAGPEFWHGSASNMPRPVLAFSHRASGDVVCRAQDRDSALCALNQFASVRAQPFCFDLARRRCVAGVVPTQRCSSCLCRVPLSMSDSSSSEGGGGEAKKIERARRRKVQPQSTDPQEAMKRWSKMLIKSGQESVDDLKLKTIRALDNLFSGGFMEEGTGGENDMLPVLRKFMMNDFEGYTPPQVASSLAEDFQNYGAPQALTAPSLKDDVANTFEGGGADLTGWGRTQQGTSAVELKLDRLQPLDRQQFSQAVQAGIGKMAVEDIYMVFDEIDKDGDGTLTLAELYDTYKAVQAEIVTDQEMVVRDVELAATKLRPATPDAAFSNLLPAPGDRTGEDEDGLSRSKGAHADLAKRMQEWDAVCEVLSTQSAYLPDEGREMLEQAVQFAGELLLTDMSEGGGNNFGDGLALGGIVAGLQSQSEAVTAAVLLPALRTGAVQSTEVRERFGPVVASIVEDSVWLSKLPERVGLLDDDGSRFLREYMVAVSRDHRAVVVMLADRLHSLRRARNAPLYEQHLRALEALQVYSPLAHALGVGKWLWELEDLSFRALFPDSYADLEQWQLDLWEESGEMMETAKSEVLDSLNNNPFLRANVQRYAITSRRKSLFSTFKKMYQKNKNLEGIKDVFAMRIVIGLKPDVIEDKDVQVRICLEAYKSMREALPHYTEGKRRYKDYASKPKPNGYQSVHTTLDTPTGLPVEIQIRTEEMHTAAEFGDAAHNLYKGGIKSLSSAQKFADSVRQTNVAVLAPQDVASSTRASGVREQDGSGEETASGLGVAGEELRQQLAGEVDLLETQSSSLLFTDGDATTVTLTREYGTRMQSELRRQREKKRIADRSVLDTVTDIDTTQSNDDGSSSQRLTGSADAAPRRRKRPPPLSSVVRGGWIRKEAEKGADKGSARVGPSRKDKKVVQRSNVYDMSAPTSMSAPTIMTAPSIVTEMEGDDLVGDTWMEDTIGQDIVATAIAPSFVSTTPAGVMESLSPDKMVFVRRENVGFGSSSRSRGGGSKLLVWRGVGAAGGGDGMGLHDKEQLGTSTFSVAMQEIELEAWRETANTIPFPLSAAYEAAYREQLRQKGSNLIERMERLRTLLDTSLVRFFDPSTMAADKFSFVDDIASLSLDLSEVESEEFHSEDWEDIESVEEMRAKEAS